MGFLGELAISAVLEIRLFKMSTGSLNHIGFLYIGSLKAKQLYFVLQKELKEHGMD